jgi:soluble cytochrome b562
MAHTAEDLVKLLKSEENSPFDLINHFPEFGEGFGDLVARLEKAEKTLADYGKRIGVLEAAQKAAAKPGG